jgi:hypothetical protein
MRHSLRPLLILALVTALLATSSCSTLRGWRSRDESEQRAQRLQEIQLKVMRFADQYSARIAEPIQRFTVEEVSPEDRLRAQNWRLSQATSAFTIASGPNPTVNALDMIVLATLSRMVVEDLWTNELYGPRAKALLDAHRGLEQEAWQLTDGVLNEDQHTQLHGMIDGWRATHPQVRNVAYIHFTDFARTGGASAHDAARSGSLFSFLGLDPLSDLDPAVREIEQTRLLAERTIYYVQRAPNLLDMQIERLTYQLAVTPELQQTLRNVDRIGVATAAVGELANNLPETVARERHATIVDLTSALDSEQTQLRALMSELRDTLAAGSSTSDSVNTTIRTLDTLMARFKPAAATTATAAPRPFDITEYAATARDVAAAAQDLRALIEQMDTSSASVERVAASASQDLQALIDHAFWRGVYLVLVLVAAVLAAALAYRFIVTGARWAAWKSIISRERSGVE